MGLLWYAHRFLGSYSLKFDWKMAGDEFMKLAANRQARTTAAARAGQLDEVHRHFGTQLRRHRERGAPRMPLVSNWPFSKGSHLSSTE